ncbi:MAG: hypothetical protein HY094_06500 [Candidatus Melainabacteria bacterium]|nr:hypothetical protein [Candidatus Melainabacteria bacterium]
MAVKIGFFNDRCVDIHRYLTAAHKAKGSNNIKEEKEQLEEAFVDFKAAIQEGEGTPQQIVNVVRGINTSEIQASEEGKESSPIPLNYLYEKLGSLSLRQFRGEQPSLKPLTGEGGMWSFPVPIIPLDELLLVLNEGQNN